MIALVFAALVSVTPNPIVVAPGEQITVEVDMGRGGFVHGAGFGAEDKTIAEAKGWLGPSVSRGTVAVRGLREGETRLIVEYIVGMGVWRASVAQIVVAQPCDPPAVTLSHERIRLVQGDETTVTAMTNGTPPVHVEWYEGGRYLARGSTFTLRGLSRGTHRYFARVTNACGVAVSPELVVDVVAPRRRRTRH